MSTEEPFKVALLKELYLSKRVRYTELMKRPAIACFAKKAGLSVSSKLSQSVMGMVSKIYGIRISCVFQKKSKRNLIPCKLCKSLIFLLETVSYHTRCHTLAFRHDLYFITI